MNEELLYQSIITAIVPVLKVGGLVALTIALVVMLINMLINAATGKGFTIGLK